MIRSHGERRVGGVSLTWGDHTHFTCFSALSGPPPTACAHTASSQLLWPTELPCSECVKEHIHDMNLELSD